MNISRAIKDSKETLINDLADEIFDGLDDLMADVESECDDVNVPDDVFTKAALKALARIKKQLQQDL
jgi:hypothetical protein